MNNLEDFRNWLLLRERKNFEMAMVAGPFGGAVGLICPSLFFHHTLQWNLTLGCCSVALLIVSAFYVPKVRQTLVEIELARQRLHAHQEDPQAASQDGDKNTDDSS